MDPDCEMQDTQDRCGKCPLCEGKAPGNQYSLGLSFLSQLVSPSRETRSLYQFQDFVVSFLSEQRLKCTKLTLHLTFILHMFSADELWSKMWSKS